VPDRICMITGANAGIGKAAAVQLAQHGCHVILACRDPQRGDAARAEVARQSGSAAVELLTVDLSLQSSIRQCAQAFHARHAVLDVLIHNAADFDIARTRRELTAEGVERVWATNHLGPVLLTDLLIEPLRRAEQGRVLTVASQGLVMHPFLRVDLDDPEFARRRYSVARAYYQSKLAQLMYTQWLAEQLRQSAVTANCVRVPNVRIDITRYPDLPQVLRSMYALKSRFAITPEAMARTYVDLALSDSLRGVTGGYFDERSRPLRPPPQARDPEAIAAVMAMTLAGVQSGAAA
jgi:NAD(P)-dependent dehydrogenase (short-subunit alcohol dehydrogenase family)